MSENKEMVNHPQHYGGENNPYEAIKVIDAWGLDNDFYLGNAVKYLSRAGKKDNTVQDLKKAIWYIEKKNRKVTTMIIRYILACFFVSIFFMIIFLIGNKIVSKNPNGKFASFWKKHIIDEAPDDIDL
jgi:hypothetical protein